MPFTLPPSSAWHLPYSPEDCLEALAHAVHAFHDGLAEGQRPHHPGRDGAVAPPPPLPGRQLWLLVLLRVLLLFLLLLLQQ